MVSKGSIAIIISPEYLLINVFFCPKKAFNSLEKGLFHSCAPINEFDSLNLIFNHIVPGINSKRNARTSIECKA